MKESRKRVGLTERHTRTAETPAEAVEILTDLADALESWLAEAQSVAGEVLRAEGVDPATLFDIVHTAGGSHVRHARIERDTLAPAAQDALDVLVKLQYSVRPVLDSPDGRRGVFAGAMLAQAFSRMVANAVWLRPVETRRAQEARLGKANESKRIPDKTKRRVLELAEQFRDKYHSDAQRRDEIAKRVGLKPGQVRYIIDKNSGRR